MPTITKGATAAEKISDDIRSSRSSFWRPKFISIKGGESYMMRPITSLDDLIVADTHSFMPTKPKPEEYSGDWIQSMWAICAKDVMFRLRDEAGNPTDSFESGYGTCYLHDHYAGKLDPKFKKDMSIPGSQTYALVVLREPVYDPATNNIVGFKDKLVEYKDSDGKIHQIPDFRVVSQKWSNFWAAVAAAAFMDGEIRNKDFAVKRKDNEYTITAAPATPSHQPGTDSWKVYEEALALVGGFDLGEYLIAHSTPDHYARWFDPDKTPEGGYARKGDGDAGETASAGDEAAAATPGAAEVDAAEMAAFQEMLAGRGDKK